MVFSALLCVWDLVHHEFLDQVLYNLCNFGTSTTCSFIFADSTSNDATTEYSVAGFLLTDPKYRQNQYQKLFGWQASDYRILLNDNLKETDSRCRARAFPRACFASSVPKSEL